MSALCFFSTGSIRLAQTAKYTPKSKSLNSSIAITGEIGITPVCQRWHLTQQLF